MRLQQARAIISDKLCALRNAGFNDIADAYGKQFNQLIKMSIKKEKIVQPIVVYPRIRPDASKYYRNWRRFP